MPLAKRSLWKKDSWDLFPVFWGNMIHCECFWWWSVSHQPVCKTSNDNLNMHKHAFSMLLVYFLSKPPIRSNKDIQLILISIYIYNYHTYNLLILNVYIYIHICIHAWYKYNYIDLTKQLKIMRGRNFWHVGFDRFLLWSPRRISTWSMNPPPTLMSNNASWPPAWWRGRGRGLIMIEATNMEMLLSSNFHRYHLLMRNGIVWSENHSCPLTNMCVFIYIIYIIYIYI